ncbi:hypothetical protein HPB50_018194 [Hyalomma asiaticum]|uniref:Uncharacterized protein n=1 Tax=Hyalomma asiaticum TaxID=266040 RepID=A0ACB7TMG0_HYAAI|nr:hypothetical protein HPB50_018194 [Hyalomma asiaticum]
MGLKVHSQESTSAVSEYERDMETPLPLFLKASNTFEVIVERQKAEAARRSAVSAKAKQDILVSGGSDIKAPTVSPGGDRLAFLDLLSHYYHQGIFSIEDMRQEVDTFMFACLWQPGMLRLTPLREYKRHMCCERLEVQYFSLAFLSLVNAVTFRDSPSGNYTIPEGCTCYVFAYGIHRDPAHYTDPEVFDPDRFLHESGSRSHPFAFVPFSAGPRNCIGQKFAMLELKVLLAKVLTNFNVSSCNHRDNLLFDADMLLRTKRPIRIRLQPRHEAGLK